MGGKKLNLPVRTALCGAVLIASLPIFISCSGMDPRDVKVEMATTAPEAKITSYTQALSDLGRMSEVFASGVTRIQCSDIADNTGTSMTTGGEIQKNITEIMKSTLNSMGGNVVFIEYDPSFIQNQMVSGYSNFENKVIPDVVITGGITEFDRALETTESGTDVAATASVSGMPSWAPSNEIGANFGDSGKASKSRITLDFNMKDFKTLAGVPKMTAINSMEVNKALKQKEIGITLFGPTFGLKGSVKKVQGRHEAVRLLVQLSMIQMVGKYMALPYWRLLGEDTLPDPIVVESVTANYYSLTPAFRIALAQQWLYVYGNDVELTGKIDAKTLAALQKVIPGFPAGSQELSEKDFVGIYLGMPYDAAALGRRNALNNIINGAKAQQQAATAEPTPVAAQQTSRKQTPAQAEPAAVTQSVAAPAQDQAPAAPSKGGNASKNTGFGTKLKNSDW